MESASDVSEGRQTWRKFRKSIKGKFWKTFESWDAFLNYWKFPYPEYAFALSRILVTPKQCAPTFMGKAVCVCYDAQHVPQSYEELRAMMRDWAMKPEEVGA